MLNTLSFYFYLLKTSIRASISKRAAFLIEAGLMITNNFIFFFIWWIFFRQIDDVGGWQFIDMAHLLAVGMGAYGFMLVFFGGIRNISRMIVNGDLDTYMTQPKNLLLHIAGSTSLSKGWGHLATSLAIIVVGGISSPQTILLIFVGIICGGLVFTSVNIIGHCLPFWMGSVSALSKKYCDALFLFALYPTNIYSGLLQIVMFTLIPAGVISYLPVELIRDFSWFKLFFLIGSTIVFFALAFLVFFSGLKRYESGNRFGIRL